jgi:hypothetical protein
MSILQHAPKEWSLSWKRHFIRKGDGNGGYLCREAQLRFAPRQGGNRVIVFGLAAMDNGEVAMIGTYRDNDTDTVWAGNQEHTIIAFSEDRGATWSEYRGFENCSGRPMMLAYLGNGVLSFIGQWEQNSYRYFSSDYGRTWSERVPLQTAGNGDPWMTEGNPLIDRDEHGAAIRIAETGCNFGDGPFPANPTCQFIRWSKDGGRSWQDEIMPAAWRWQAAYRGKTYERSVSEGALVRAANGWIVAALRTDVMPHHIPLHYDNYEGIGASISKDDGATWSPLLKLYDAGRMHPNLLRLPDDRLVMTYILRADMHEGDLISYGSGCEALVSRDNGLSWDQDAKYVLDEFAYFDEEKLCISGHLYSTLLDDGSVLTTYGNYITGSVLIRWTPTS